MAPIAMPRARAKIWVSTFPSWEGGFGSGGPMSRKLPLFEGLIVNDGMKIQSGTQPRRAVMC